MLYKRNLKDFSFFIDCRKLVLSSKISYTIKIILESAAVVKRFAACKDCTYHA